MDIEDLKQKIESALIDDGNKQRDLSSYLPQLTFYKVHGITYKENYHSKFIAFLLNPEKNTKKKHGCGSAFLDLFINILNKKICNENDKLSFFDYYKAIPEIGYEINRIKIIGGRVDICICKTLMLNYCLSYSFR